MEDLMVKVWWKLDIFIVSFRFWGGLTYIVITCLIYFDEILLCYISV